MLFRNPLIYQDNGPLAISQPVAPITQLGNECLFFFPEGSSNITKLLPSLMSAAGKPTKPGSHPQASGSSLMQRGKKSAANHTSGRLTASAVTTQPRNVMFYLHIISFSLNLDAICFALQPKNFIETDDEDKNSRRSRQRHLSRGSNISSRRIKAWNVPLSGFVSTESRAEVLLRPMFSSVQESYDETRLTA